MKMRVLLPILAAALLWASPTLAAAAKSNPLNAIGAWVTADVDAGNAAATAYPNLQDQVALICGVEIKALAQIVHDHPLPLTAHLWTDVVYARLVQGEFNRICRVPECAQVFADMANAAQALSIAPLPFSFTSSCAKVPVVGLTPTSAPAAAAPAAK
jgi:hypothetical protein